MLLPAAVRPSPIPLTAAASRPLPWSAPTRSVEPAGTICPPRLAIVLKSPFETPSIAAASRYLVTDGIVLMFAPNWLAGVCTPDEPPSDFHREAAPVAALAAVDAALTA